MRLNNNDTGLLLDVNHLEHFRFQAVKSGFSFKSKNMANMQKKKQQETFKLGTFKRLVSEWTTSPSTPSEVAQCISHKMSFP